MDTFISLVVSMAPLYLLVAFGFVAGKKLAVDSRSIAAIVVYVLAPFITFHAAATTSFTVATLSLPVVFLVLSLVCSWIFFQVGKLLFFHDAGKRYLLAATAGSGNAGYFGLGLALVLFSNEQVRLVILSVLGFIVYIHTFGFYLTARGNFSPRESLLKLARLPVMYAFVLGLLAQWMHIPFGVDYGEVMNWFKGSYTVLGMLMVGLSVATIRGQVFDATFTIATLVAKFVVWPALALGILLLNAHVLHWYNYAAQEVIWLLSIVPIATNTVTYANLLEVHSDVSAVSVLVSTVSALAYIPLAWYLFHYFA